jgi:hypothetical protein
MIRERPLRVPVTQPCAGGAYRARFLHRLGVNRKHLQNLENRLVAGHAGPVTMRRAEYHEFLENQHPLAVKRGTDLAHRKPQCPVRGFLSASRAQARST